MNKETFNAQLKAANRRGLESRVGKVHATFVRYDQSAATLVLTLRGGLTFVVPVYLLQGVAQGAPKLIERVELASDGAALHWEELDADFAIQDIAAGSFGTPAWMQKLEDAGLLDESSIERRRAVALLRGTTATEMGRKGGAARTGAKSQAARANGAKGGRPRKTPVPA